MALITGTVGTDTLIGTADADILQPFSTASVDVLRGLDGADVYDLRRSGTSLTYNVLIDDRGTDGSENSITGVGSLYQSASFGYQGYATAIRLGDDLIIHTPSRPHRFRKPARPDYDIEIKDQYDGGHVNSINAGGKEYSLSRDFLGTRHEDLMAGTRRADIMEARAGDDWLFGNGGRDELNAGKGNDIVFGGSGGDTITATGGDNLIFAENGHDRIATRGGNDRIEAGKGNDIVSAGGGADSVQGEEGRDRLRGEAGDDLLDGGRGNDTLVGGVGQDTLRSGPGDDHLVGGRGGDIYQISVLDGGHKTVRDKGNAPLPGIFATANDDILVITGFADLPDAMHGLSLQIAGNDLVLFLKLDGAAAAASSQITLLDQFAGPRSAIEKIAFGTRSLATDFSIVQLTGDLATFSVHDGADVGGNDIVLGTGGNDVLYGGINNNIYLGGAGADVFLFKDQEDNRGGLDLILDFDVAVDRIDLKEIATLDRSGLSISDNAAGNAVISSLYETIELVGVSSSAVTDDIFIFTE